MVFSFLLKAKLIPSIIPGFLGVYKFESIGFFLNIFQKFVAIKFKSIRKSRFCPAEFSTKLKWNGRGGLSRKIGPSRCKRRRVVPVCASETEVAFIVEFVKS